LASMRIGYTNDITAGMGKVMMVFHLSDRRNFLKRSAQTILGSVIAFLALPQLRTQPDVSAIGEKQLRLLLAAKALAEKAGMLRAYSIYHYALDTGEIEMDWSVIIPPEDSITADTDNLAREVLALVNK